MNDVAKLTDEQRARLFPIILERHNPQWKTWYMEEKQNILANANDIAAIHHYGSTSIPNIAAKPTVDILIEIEKNIDLEKLKQSFIDLDYNYMSFGEPPAMLFVKGYTSSGFAQRVFHIHVYYRGLQKPLLFRNYLISHPELAKEYETLKLGLKDKFEFDRDRYTYAKNDFIKTITEKAVDEYKKAKA